MSGNGTNGYSAGLPMVLAPSAPRSSYRRAAPGAAFLSQLIAERQHLAPQRARRRAPVAEAVDAYRSTSRVTVVRMPAGYRRTVVA
jgi:hypothetical protein